MTRIRLSTSRSWNNRDTGERTTVTDWHSVVFWGKLAETAAEFLRRGSAVYLEGELRTRKYQDRNGTDKWTTEINASSLQILPTPTDPIKAGGSPDLDPDIPF